MSNADKNHPRPPPYDARCIVLQTPADAPLPLETQANFPIYVCRYAEIKEQDKDLYENEYFRSFIYNQIRKYWHNNDDAEHIFHQIFGIDFELPDPQNPPRILKRYNFTDWERFLSKTLDEIELE